MDLMSGSLQTKSSRASFYCNSSSRYNRRTYSSSFKLIPLGILFIIGGVKVFSFDSPNLFFRFCNFVFCVSVEMSGSYDSEAEYTRPSNAIMRNYFYGSK